MHTAHTYSFIHSLTCISRRHVLCSNKKKLRVILQGTYSFESDYDNFVRTDAENLRAVITREDENTLNILRRTKRSLKQWKYRLLHTCDEINNIFDKTTFVLHNPIIRSKN